MVIFSYWNTFTHCRVLQLLQFQTTGVNMKKYHQKFFLPFMYIWYSIIHLFSQSAHSLMRMVIDCMV